ncbi:hypothetical protein SZ25_00569, partial [Candidatus Arcanobacter lacustris]
MTNKNSYNSKNSYNFKQIDLSQPLGSSGFSIYGGGAKD